MLALHLLLRGDELDHIDATVKRVVINHSGVVFAISGDKPTSVVLIGSETWVVLAALVAVVLFLVLFMLEALDVATAENESPWSPASRQTTHFKAALVLVSLRCT